MAERPLDQCDNGCRRAAERWTSEGYVCLGCYLDIEEKRQEYREQFEGRDYDGKG